MGYQIILTNMMYFRPKKTISKKLTFSLTLLLIFGIGTVVFFSNKNMLTNYKSYYFQSYTYVLPYEIKELLKWSKSTEASNITASTSQYAESIPVLVYHGVLGGPVTGSDGEGTNIDLATFWEQMKTLKEAGWRTITM